MIIHKLIALHLREGDYHSFYRLQAQAAIEWLERQHVPLTPETTLLDLGCGHGVFGAELLKRGCRVTFADEGNHLFPGIKSSRFVRVNLDQEDIRKVGTHDLVICSNVLEHLALPARFIASVGSILNPAGHLYLSWTNWLSPWGGHEFSPFHYLGSKRGPLLYDKWIKKKRIHTPFKNLFPTYIGPMLKLLRAQPDPELVRAVPRYYSEFSFLTAIPIVREFLTWNCAVLLRKRFAGKTT